MPPRTPLTAPTRPVSPESSETHSHDFQEGARPESARRLTKPGEPRPAARAAPPTRPPPPSRPAARTHQVKSWSLSPRSRLPSAPAAPCAYGCGARGPAGEAASMQAGRPEPPDVPGRGGRGAAPGRPAGPGLVPARPRSLARASLPGPRRSPSPHPAQASGAGPDTRGLQPGPSRGAALPRPGTRASAVRDTPHAFRGFLVPGSEPAHEGRRGYAACPNLKSRDFATARTSLPGKGR